MSLGSLASPGSPGSAPAAIGARGGGEQAAWELATADGGDRARCAAFLDRLDAMPRRAWLNLGRTLLLERAEAGAAATASALLDRVIAARQLTVTAWLVRDRVETAAHLARRDGGPTDDLRHPMPPCSSAELTLLAAARNAAERAALAHLTSPWLPRADHLTLILPFLTLVGVEIP